MTTETVERPVVVAIPQPSVSFLQVFDMAGFFLLAIFVWWLYTATLRLQRDINGKMDKLLALTATSSKAEGVLEERERQMNRRKMDRPA